jgi:hypothetical protein
MPYGEPDDTDPMMLNGVMLEDGEAPPLDAVREMAECFIDEYARLGYDANRILHMFRTKGYAGPHMATEILGEIAIRALVDDVLARWGGRRTSEIVQQKAKDHWSLTVLGH